MTNCSNVIFSCVSYRRNIKDMLFVNKLSDFEQAIAISRSMSEIFGDMLEFKSLKNIPLVDCLNLQEKGIFTRELIENKDISAYGISDNGESRILINEEDHIRIIVQKIGFNLEDCFSLANDMDDMVLEKLEMAFDNNLGYLTANPFKLGTGMEISVALFIPALTFSGKLKKISKTLLCDEFEFLNLDGRQWNSQSPFVILKNVYTFGYKENEFATKLQKLTEKIIELEKTEENNQFNISASTLIDTIYRAYGVATNSYRISFEDAEEKLGYVLWGINLKALKTNGKFDLCDILAKIKDNHLGTSESIKEIEKKRAKILTQILSTCAKGVVDV